MWFDVSLCKGKTVQPMIKAQLRKTVTRFRLSSFARFFTMPILHLPALPLQPARAGLPSNAYASHMSVAKNEWVVSSQN